MPGPARCDEGLSRGFLLNTCPHRTASSHTALPFRRTATSSCSVQGFRTSLTRRKGSAAYELFPEFRRCSFNVFVWNNRQYRTASSHTVLPFRRTATSSSGIQGFRTSLTRRKGSPAYELFPGFRRCSFNVFVWNNRQYRTASSHTVLPFRRTATSSCSVQGFRTSLTRRKGSPACELFPEFRRCCFIVCVPARRLPVREPLAQRLDDQFVDLFGVGLASGRFHDLAD